MAGDGVPRSRVRRAARVGRLTTGEAVKQIGTRVANVARREPAADDALARRQLEMARQIVAALGTMKGAAMKLGQMLSFVDIGLVSEEHRDEFQQELAKLRDAAPAVSTERMRAVIESELDEPLEHVFAAFDEEPIAAASIGQVYRAVLRKDGREVAVKVQYPGVAAAVRGDMRTLSMVMRPLKRFLPRTQVDQLLDELAERFAEELDYEMEAQNQRSLARIYRRHPFIVIPDVVSPLCRERMLVTEFVSGTGFEELKDERQQERDRIGEIIFRFFLGSLYRHRQFSGDPHPGNFLRLADGCIAFLDFGLFKRMDRASVELEIGLQRAVAESDSASLCCLLAQADFLTDPERLNVDIWMTFLTNTLGWYTAADEVLEVTPELSRSVLAESLDPQSGFVQEIRRQGVRPEHLIGRRMETLTLASLGQLRARANWCRIAREWIYGEEPITELGQQEAAFYAQGSVPIPPV
jgi:predicted unusual protein kinase regulating ubiquinone biosynthesis (AarF/ABC1/UbiB family)